RRVILDLPYPRNPSVPRTRPRTGPARPRYPSAAIMADPVPSPATAAPLARMVVREGRPGGSGRSGSVAPAEAPQRGQAAAGPAAGRERTAGVRPERTLDEIDHMFRDDLRVLQQEQVTCVVHDHVFGGGQPPHDLLGLFRRR